MTMPLLDSLYCQTITLFNRVSRRGEPTMWIPTVITGVHLVTRKSSSWSNNGGKSVNDVTLHIRFQNDGDKILVKCGKEGQTYKQWCEPRAWKKLDGAEGFITFSHGNNDNFDFFIEGEFTEFPYPISDENFEFSGFYAYMLENYDNVFAIKAANKFTVIPHFEILAG